MQNNIQVLFLSQQGGSVVFTYRIPVLAVLNQKGGVGKTTVSAVLAEYAAIALGLRVLVVDLDMQCNSSDYWVGMEPAPNATGGQLPPPHPDYDGDPDIEERSSIADTFFGKAALPYPTYIEPNNGFKGRVEILMGHPERLERINTEFDNASGRIDSEVIQRIGNVLHQEAIVEDYDLVILDTGPSRNPVFRAALRAATHTVIPFEPEEKSLQGINAMLQAITSENFSRNPEDEVKLVGLLPNKVRTSTRIHMSTLDMLREELPEILCPSDIFLPQSTAYPERDIKGITPKSIFQIANSHKARQQAELVGDYVLSNVLGDIRYRTKKKKRVA
jgi:chromosome partitioning protein